MKRLSLLCCLAVASCGDLTVDFTLHKDPSVGALQSLSIEVVGTDEPFASTPLPLSRFSGDEATVRFVPAAKVGTTLHFVFHVVADSTFDVPVDVTLKDGHNPTDVTLNATGIQPGDMAMPMDMAVSCTTAKDCSAAAPVCSADHVCTGCTSVADCTAFDASLAYCGPSGACTVCQPKAGTCQDAMTLKICADDGSGVSTATCPLSDCNQCTGQCGAQYCEGTKIVTCDSTGAKADVMQCSWQCQTGTCIVMLPSHFDRGSYSLANPADIVLNGTDDAVVNTTTNPNQPTYKLGAAAATNWATWSNGADPNNVTIVVHNLTIGAGRTLSITGPRNVIFAVTGNVQIDGTLDASSHGAALGPGAVAPTADQNNYNSGRPGAGHATAGGNGGAGNGSSTIPGLPALTDTDIAGGTFKAGPSGGYVNYGSSGGGGGAVQVSALGTITVSATGKILANGDGGGGGEDGGNNWPGNGGGAGGSILLEASTVTIAGVLAANGGSGGGIDMSGIGINGVGGQASAVPAPASMPAGAECTGGKGGAGTTAPTAGSVGANYGAGGGGGYGRIRVRVLGALPTFSGVISPSGSDAYLLDNVVTANGN